jgi:glycosyltransferase involved in cell wall biosynthesis
MTEPRVALIHDYLVQYGGAEKTLEAISELFPEAPIYTGVYKPAKLSAYLNGKKIMSPQNFFLQRFTKYLSFLMPLVFENFDLRNYDLIISDTACWAKGVLTTPAQLHISYIHTPPRFLYKYAVETTKRNAWYFKPFVTVIDTFLRAWDYAAGQKPDFLLANSLEVQKRIHKFYKRDSQVIYPPVEIAVAAATKAVDKPCYVALGRLVAYKNFDLVVKAFNATGLKLIVVGTGQEENKLKKLAGSNVEFVGQVSDAKKNEILENALGLVNAVSDEDFGIVPLEAMAHGKPVLVHNSGGAVETVVEGENGMFFEELTVDCLTTKLKAFDHAITSHQFNADKIKASVIKFSKERFQKEFKAFVMEKWHARATGSNNNSN